MRNEKQIQKIFKDHPEILDKVLEGLDSYTSISEEGVPSFNDVYGDIIKEHFGAYENKKIEPKKKSIFLKKVAPKILCILRKPDNFK